MTRHYKQKAKTLDAQLVGVKTERSQLLAKINFRPGLRHVSCFGGYSLALKRNDAGTSTGAGAAAMLVAGDDFRGGLHDKKVVLKYEHLAACAKRCRSEQLHSDFAEDGCLLQEQIANSFEVFCYRGDATNQEAIDHEKVHTNLIASMMLHHGHDNPYDDILSESDSYFHLLRNLFIMGMRQVTCRLCSIRLVKKLFSLC